jgi:type VI secretion system protein ImpH
MSDLMTRLMADPQGFDLFQVLHLLERAAPERAHVGTSLGVDEAVQLHADPTLAFASSDITELASAPDAAHAVRPPFHLRSAAVSLAGAQGPLPVAFTELLLERMRRRDPSGLEFLDIFNWRTLAFLHRSRVKHRLALQGGHPANSAVARLIDALSGLGMASGSRGPQGDWPWMRHAAIQGAAPRSMASLQALLADGMGLKVQGHSLRGAWITLPTHERAVLGRPKGGAHSALRLGVNGSLGLKAWDQAAAIECRVEPVDRTTLEALLPGQTAHRRMAWLVQRHLQSPLRVEVRATLTPQAARLCKLSSAASASPGTRARLGATAWLGGRGRQPGSQPSAQPGARPEDGHGLGGATAQATRFLLRT